MDVTPTLFFGAGFTETGTGATHEIKLATAAHTNALVTELSEAEADPSTGDYRKIIFALMEMLYAKYTAASVKPSKLSVTRSTYEDVNTSELVRTYTITIRTLPTGLEVNSEPA